MEKNTVLEHYDENYFSWQNKNAHIGAKINAKKFKPYINNDQGCILDFGCGGGFLLTQLSGSSKIGIEINPKARDVASNHGYEVYGDLNSIPDASVDFVVSNHALEHVEHPLNIFRDLYRVVKIGGRIIIVVPCDRANYPYSSKDKDFHLYSWSSGNIANLAKASGFEILKSEEIVHRWPPFWSKLAVALPDGLFHLICIVYGHLKRNRSQVRLVAIRMK